MKPIITYNGIAWFKCPIPDNTCTSNEAQYLLNAKTVSLDVARLLNQEVSRFITRISFAASVFAAAIITYGFDSHFL
jgi:hypothetical protein